MLLASTGLLATSAAQAQSTAFRYDDLDLRDPHVFVVASFLGCRDVTDANITGFSVNEQIQTRISTDDDGDGFLDLSSLIEFLSLDQNQSTNLIAAGPAQCTAPIETTRCGEVAAGGLSGDATLSSTTTCLAPLAGTLRPYAPAVASTGAACFASPAGTLTLDLGGIPVTLRQAQLAATFNAVPASRLNNGLVRGFISEADADATILPASLPLVGGQSLSSLLPGGTGNCAAHSDKDVLDGTTGWWFYLNFTAPTVARVLDNFVNGFADGFE